MNIWVFDFLRVSRPLKCYRKQLALVLGHALSMHKAQGLTLDKVKFKKPRYFIETKKIYIKIYVKFELKQYNTVVS